MLALGRIDAAARAFWPRANRHVLWGWKRDAGDASRLVYFSGDVTLDGDVVRLGRGFFFYRHRADRGEAHTLLEQLERSTATMTRLLGKPELELTPCRRTGLGTLRYRVGIPLPADLDRTRRLQLRRPRAALARAHLPEPAPLRGLLGLLPFDLYAGSGLSYEAGLPTLCDMHDAFCLDDHQSDRFTVGRSDKLPWWLGEDPEAAMRGFCDLHLRALSAVPTYAQQVIADLHRRGGVSTVMSDNVDNLLCKVDVPFVRTRGSGVFNERFPAEFATRTLVVVGVAADRRQIVRQGRARRMRVVVVNPCSRVSPRVQHLNYLRPGDLFYRTTAEEFFTALGEEAREPIAAAA